jgi:hypothetical protein
MLPVSGRAKHCYSGSSDPTTTAHDPEATWFGLLRAVRSLAGGDILLDTLISFRVIAAADFRPSKGMMCCAMGHDPGSVWAASWQSAAGRIPTPGMIIGCRRRYQRHFRLTAD